MAGSYYSKESCTFLSSQTNSVVLFYFQFTAFFLLSGLIPSLALQQHRQALQKQKREQDLKEQRELERNSPAKKKGGSSSRDNSCGSGGSGSAASLLCARKSNKRKRLSSPFKKGNENCHPTPLSPRIPGFYSKLRCG